MMCARCRVKLRWEDCQGESGIYSPNRSFTLCEPCFEEEDREIDVHGTNELPERIEEYKRNLRMGPLNFRSIAARSPIRAPVGRERRRWSDLGKSVIRISKRRMARQEDDDGLD